MILLEQATEAVLHNIDPTGTERVKMEQCLGRVLAQDVRSDIDMPPFDKSAVDGYACRAADLGGNLSVLETIPAGSMPKKEVLPRSCSKIMTGAMVPAGADCVIMVEETEEFIAGSVRFTGVKKSSNICYRGEDIKAGDLVLEKGTLIRPQEIAVLASTGTTSPLVHIRPVVSIITTGDELVPPGKVPKGPMIRNSNSYQLEAQVSQTGAVGVNLGIVADKERLIRETISDALSGSDIVLLTGGVSMGDYDYVPDIMKSMGIHILFRSIAIQPGKPTVFGKAGNKLIFGLPGNPVSSFVLFEVLVKPAIMAMMGRTVRPITYPVVLGQDIFRRKTDRKALVPVTIRNGEAFPVDYHGSAHINAYTSADGIVTIDIGVNELKKGTITHVRPV